MSTVPNSSSAADAQAVISAQVQAFGSSFQPAIGPGYKTTQEYLTEEIDGASRPYSPMGLVQPWECRIGGSRFYVPPIAINVSTNYATGSAGAALRQQAPVRFNSGHSETVINMTLYFPTHDTIWGFSGDSITIDFDNGPDDVIDTYMSSLRGLITEFKYTPILPVKNVYLNASYNITAVALQSMSISSSENFPFCLVVSLTMLKFNHSVLLPMVDNFDDAIHWGRFRQYVGRAANQMQAIASKDFLQTTQQNQGPGSDQDPANRQASDAAPDYRNVTSFDKITEFQEGKNIELFYPDQDPARIVAPAIGSFRDDNTTAGGSDWWDSVTKYLGLPATGIGSYTNITQFPNSVSVSQTFKQLTDWMKRVQISYSQMGPDKLNQFIDSQVNALPPNSSAALKAATTQSAQQSWYQQIYQGFLNDPTLSSIFALQQVLRGQIQIDEWDVPMRKLGLDNPNVIVNGVVVSLGNSLVPLQLTLQDQPTYQHIGGLGATIEINMTVMGEDDLGRLRAMYDTINGLSRLEHGHALLGFLGIKNVITALAGVKYCIPSAFEVSTIPNYPHVYSVRLVFLDFDVFQQKRELLSSAQQEQFVEAFSKKNPFLRIKQLWSAFNAYPDFPLSVRDTDGTVLGHLDPDYYFRAFQVLDDDIVGWRQKKLTALQQEDAQLNSLTSTGPTTTTSTKSPQDYEIIHHLGNLSDDNTSSAIGLHAGGFDLMENGKAVIPDCTFSEPHAGNTLTTPYVDGCTPAGNYMTPYFDNTDNPDSQFDAMLLDNQYRDKSGRMIRAFPTYMLWLIDEGGTPVGVKAFDNFYGLQSVLDVSIVRSEDILGDTMVLRISNLYSRLSTQYKDLVDPTFFPISAPIIDTQLSRERNLLSDFTNYVVKLDTINLQPGVRVHMRMGYSANPNLLETVFNGVITQVEQGDIITVTCQSDAIELGAIIDNKNKNAGTSDGQFDGSLTGLWTSEPRDLMTRLLSMGGSIFKENIAHATHGMIYSENRFGIRHFGSILYEPMTDSEKSLTDAKTNKMNIEASGWAGFFSSGGPAGAVAGMLTAGVGDIMTTMWININRKRDYEVFKRNIYPGNGTGVAQYMGGDLGDGGLANMFMPVGVSPDGSTTDPSTGVTPVPDAATILGQAAADAKVTDGVNNPFEINTSGVTDSLLKVAVPGFALFSTISTKLGFNPKSLLAGGSSNPTPHTLHPILTALHLTSETGDDDVNGFDEVSFRAQTYMKTVWDMFLLCAALLPNYIVAVRPFENRSTVFYGKPHWMYTSGVIPLTQGSKEGEGPAIEPPDDTNDQLTRQVEQKVNAQETPSQFYDKLSKLTPEQWGGPAQNNSGGDPTDTTAGVAWSGGDISSLPLIHPTTNAAIPTRNGVVSVEMHLPTSDNLQTDINQHKQLDSLPQTMKHPFYMDRVGGTSGGYTSENQFSATGTILKGDNANNPGKPGAFGILPPNEEQWYMNMRWEVTSAYPKNYEHTRVLIYCERTKKAVICVPGEFGPASFTNRVGGVSPDVWFELGQPNNSSDICWFGWVDDTTALGPVAITSNTMFKGSGLPATAAIPGTTSTAPAPVTAGAGTPTVPSTSDMPQWMKQYPAQNAGLDVNTFSLQWGWEDKNVPVDFKDASVADAVGDGAAQVYAGQKTDDQANEIWNEFRDHFSTDGKTQDIFKRYYPDEQARYTEIINSFLKFMWLNAYHRGWVVLTADSSSTFGSTIPIAGVSLGDVKTAASGLLTPLFGTGPVKAVQGVIDVTDGKNPFSSGDLDHWDFSHASDLFQVYITQPGNNNAAAIEWMQNNNSPGSTNNGSLAQAASTLKTDVWDKVVDILKSGYNTAVALGSGVVSLMRMSLMTLSGGLSMASYSGRQANLLNRTFNDSIYYAQKPIGSLLYYADNAFTREYGEPVVEIRQPFQRMHYVDSFNHIINNGIIENFDGIYTVVTAVSGQGHPVTVAFDKGAPTEKQIEKSVETGLFYDKPSGPIGSVEHPIEFLRSWDSHFNNGDQETSAKRVALWNLKQSLKDIYSGEVMIIGDPSIRPFDLVSIADVYEKIYGMFEVEQVIHHMSPDTGFITCITPNAIVNINDPGRWEVGSIMQKQYATHALRSDLRHQLNVNGSNSRLYGLPATVNASELIDRAESSLQGSIQYNGGLTGIVKDIGGMAGIGGVLTNAISNPIASIGSLSALGPASAGLAVLGFGAWKAFGWLRDNVLDAHGCYIQYLTKNGQPMDAGMNYNHGVAVGQVHGYTILKDSLNLQIPIPIDGNTVISTNDLLANLGWNEQEIDSLANQDIDIWTNDINRQILNLSNRVQESPIGVPPQTAYVTVTSIQNGDTINVSPAVNGHTAVRLTYAIASHDNVGTVNSPGWKATQYAIKRLIDDQIAAGYDPTVALRINATHQTDVDGALLAVVFSNVDPSITPDNRQAELLRIAGNFPTVQWDSYLADGRPYSFNWETILAGNADVDSGAFSTSIPGEGVIGAGI